MTFHFKAIQTAYLVRLVYFVDDFMEASVNSFSL
jgi:hypothetical protein